MNEKKSNLTGDIPARIPKVSVDSYLSILTKILSALLERYCFPNQLESVEVTPALKKEDELVITLIVFFPTHPIYLKEQLS